MLHVAQISFFSDPHKRTPEQLLSAWPTLANVAEAASCAGVRVSVVQAAAYSQEIARNGVTYHFLPDDGGGLEARLRSLAPDVLHVQGLSFARETSALARAFPGVPILLQDHASRLPRWWRRGAWRRGLSVAAALSFCSLDQAAPFSRAGLISSKTRVCEIPESTSRFEPGDRARARLQSGVTGDPSLLWVGHLDRNKDPLTVLDGVSEAARVLPGLQLWCCFANAPLLRDVELRIAGDAMLKDRVHLLGPVSHAKVETLMRAADLFVLGSHREGSGYSLIEALACGLPPVVTDIPSFRTLTGGGRVGALWPRGDARKFCESLKSAAARPRTEGRLAARAHFDRELSFAALGAKLARAYRELEGQHA